MELLKVSNLHFSYSSLKVLNGVNLNVSSGEVVALIGPSGCGKSTLLNILMGLLSCNQGKLYWKREEVPHIRGKAGLMQQKDLLLPWFTLEENLLLPFKIQKIQTDIGLKKIRETLPLFGLQGFEKAFPNSLSGGMRQRAALLRTYLYHQDFLLLDEPFGALDAFTRYEMQSWLRKTITALGTSVFMITHDVDEALLLADRVLVLSPRPAEVILELDVRDSGDRTQWTTTTTTFQEEKQKILQALGFSYKVPRE